ncbi:MAG: YbjN domain-containing protein [Gemmatimonadetes bacterium]|nr:YbjN domain-containing protein [Gemmatimonadota bacterium]
MSEIAALGELVGRLLDRLEDGASLEAFQEPLRRGSAAGHVSIVPDEHEPGAYVMRVRLKIMAVPTGAARGAFTDRLLALNHGFGGRAAFSVDDGVAWLTSANPVAHLDPSDLIDLLLWTAAQADHYDDILLDEFGHELRI